MSIKSTPSLLNHLSFIRALHFVVVEGRSRYRNITRARVQFLLLCDSLPEINRKTLLNYLPERNRYSYIRTLRDIGLIYKGGWNRYLLTDQGRRLVAEFWDEYHKRVKNFRW